MKHSWLSHLKGQPLVWSRLGSALLVGGWLSATGIGSVSEAVAAPSAHSAASVNSLQIKQTQPDQLPVPLAIVQLNTNTLDVRVINASGAELNYQVIGDTEFRTLGAQSDITLQDLSIPTTMTFRRSDGGLLSPTIEANNSEGTLTLILQPTESFTSDRTTLRIEPTGAVYLN